MEQFWPGPVTLLFNAHPDARPPKGKKSLTTAEGWLGVRMPEDPIAQSVVATFGRPVVVSSANLAHQGGAHSVAQVKKNFGRTVDILIDAGDLSSASNSTLVDVSDQQPSVVRDGAVKPDAILGAIAS